jgi:PhnB protein
VNCFWHALPNSNVIPGNPRESGGRPGIKEIQQILDSRFRGNDGIGLSTLLTNFSFRILDDLEEEPMSTVMAVPAGHRTVTPYLAIKNAAKALEFYKKAFGATESYKLMMPDGRLGHAEICLGDSVIMLADEFPEYGGKAPETLGGSPVSIHLYVEDVDALFKQALAAGAKELKPVMDQFYGDRSGQLEDPFGHLWWVATHREDVAPEELQKRVQAMFAGKK